MSELGGFGDGIPLRARRLMLADDARARVEGAAAEKERQRKADEHARAGLEFWRQEQEFQGNYVSPLVLAGADGPADDAERDERTRNALQERLDLLTAQARKEAQDLADNPPPPGGPPEVLNVAEPVIHARGEAGLKIFNRARRFFDRVDADRRAAVAARASELDWGIVPGVVRTPREDQVFVAGPSHRSADDRPVSFR